MVNYCHWWWQYSDDDRSVMVPAVFMVVFVAGVRRCQEPANPDAAPLLAQDAVQLPESLRKQLSDFGLDADLETFFRQRALKAQAREIKAQKAISSFSLQ